MAITYTSYGYMGKIAKVDLSTSSVTILNTADYATKYIGGRGIAEKLYWDMVEPETKAFDPENCLIFMTSPLVGTLSPTANHTVLASKRASSLPYERFGTSTAGGHFGPELKRAGFDGLIVTGASKKPVYLWINDGVIEIRSASLSILWGLDTAATTEELQRRHGGSAQVYAIGPAGENLCREAAITTDAFHAFGTGGHGAVMGSKMLKAIVVKGTGSVKVAEPGALMTVCDKVRKLLTKKDTEEGPVNTVRRQPSWFWLHFQSAGGRVPRWSSETEGKAGTARLGTAACANCPVGCGLTIKYLDGSGAAVQKCAKPFFEMTTKEHYDAVQAGRLSTAAGELAQRLGINAQFVSPGPNLQNIKVPLALYEAGLITKESTGINWDEVGTEEFWNNYTRKVVYREGEFGNDAAEGWWYLCNKLGEQALEIHNESYTKYGEEIGWGPGMYYFAMLYQVLGMTMQHCPTIWLEPYAKDPNFSDDQAAQAVKNISKKFIGDENAIPNQDSAEYAIPIAKFCIEQNLLIDTLSLCGFNFPNTFSNYTEDNTGEFVFADLYNAVTGNSTSEEEMSSISARIFNLNRLIMLREGHVDELGAVFFAGPWADRETFAELTSEFRQSLGWNPETGIPTRETLESLGLKAEADEIETKYGITLPA